MKTLFLAVIFLFNVLSSYAQPSDVIMWYDCDHGALINSRPDHGWWSLNPGYPADPQQGGILLNNYYYLKRASDGAILCSARPPMSDKFVWNNWVVSVSAETEVYFEIVDSNNNNNNTGNGFSWLAANMLIIGSDSLDFRTGTYANWEVVSGNAFGTQPNSVIHGSMSGQNGKYWADSYSGAGESGIGTLRSKKITLKSGTTRVKFLKAGWDGSGGTGPWRTTTSLLGTYESQDSAVIKQHAYWIKALGCDVLACDLTNSSSPGQAGLGDDMKRFVTGVNKAFELQLQWLPKISDFDAPTVYPVVRLTSTNYSNLTLMLNDMYTLYQKYPDKWYKFDDHSANNAKPFITIFVDGDLLNTWALSGIPAGAKDDRFNIRYSNGYLLAHANITAPDNNNIYKIPGNLPYWLFVENSQEVSSPGYYKPIYKETTDGLGVEQMTTWASICINGSNWDGLRDTINSKIPIVRYTEPVYNLKPKVLVVNRFNYSIAWLTEPQEGVSRNKSTHIEPNADWGFLEFNDVANELYNVRAYPKAAPPVPLVDTSNIQSNTLKIKLDGFPLEYRLSNEPDVDTCSWSFLNVGNGGIKLNFAIDPKRSIYIQTRNSFGVSPIGKIDLNYIDITKQKYDDTDAAITYTGTWEFGEWDGYYNTSCHYTWQEAAIASYTFTGTGIKLIAAKNADHGIAQIFIDGNYMSDVDFYNESAILQVVVYADSLLSNGIHTIEIKATGTKRAEATGSYIDIDAFEVIQNLTTGLGNRDLDFSGNYVMLQNNPNPFDLETQISYILSKSSNIKISVYNLMGQKVTTLINEQQMPGNYAIRFDGSGLESGVYFYQFQSGNYSITKKMILKK
jgi:hypothetical protein